VLHHVARDDHSVTVNPSVRPVPVAVLIRDLEADQASGERRVLGHAAAQAATHVVEEDPDRVTLGALRCIHRPRVNDVLIVGRAQRPKGQAQTDGLFVLRVDVRGVADLNGDRETALRIIEGRHGLGFAEFGPGGLGGLLLNREEVGELDDDEGEVALTPTLAPVLNHGRQQAAILPGARSVGLALIPGGALDGHGDDRVDHGVEEVARAPVVVGAGRRAGFARRRLPSGFGLGDLLPPSRDCLVLVFFEGSGVVIDDRHPGLEGGLILAGGQQLLGAGPGLGGCAAPTGVDKADGYAKVFVELAAEEVTHAREAADYFGSAGHPCARAVIERLGRDLARVVEEAQVGVVRGSDLFGGVPTAADGHGHVRLA